MFTVEEVLEATGGRLISGDPKVVIPWISIDSRTIEPGELFVAVRGKNFDGHDFVSQALSKGAVGVVVSNSSIATLSRVLIRVRDTIKALGDIANFHRRRFSIPIIGITGSNGKTTTKDMVASIVSQRYTTLKNDFSFNNFIGLPLTLLRLTQAHQVGVVELGSSRLGEIKRLSEVARPTHGLITNVGASHLEFFGSVDAVYREKLELLASLGENSTALINGDDQRLLRLAWRFGIKVITFGMGEGCDFRATRISYRTDGLSFLLNESLPIELKLLGRHNVYNALASITMAQVFGLDLDLVRQALLAFRPPFGRMEQKMFGQIKVIDDTYNSNPQSMGCAIETLSRNSIGRKILVSGDMLELGEGTRLAHYRMGKKVAEAGIDLLITVGRFAKEIAGGALKYGMGEDEVFVVDSYNEANQMLLKMLKEGDTVLIKGSRATKMEKVVESLVK